jgi:MFS family permease
MTIEVKHNMSPATPTRPLREKRDFWLFFTGETISNLGGSFTQFALPLLVFKLTGSALNLGLATAATYLPYLLFSLVIGAWMDRLNRKRVMILVDIGQALMLASIPVLFISDSLYVWWLYGVAFIGTTLKIIFDSGQFAAIPSLVDRADLIKTNRRIQASYSAATILGPLLASAFLWVMPLPLLLFLDAGSYLVSAASLSLISVGFNDAPSHETRSLARDIKDGLRFVFHHPVLRNISLMLALVNALSINESAQLPLFVVRHLHASYAQYSWFNAVGAACGVVVLLVAGRFPRWAVSRVILITMLMSGVLTVVFAFTPNLWFALPVWAGIEGSVYLCIVYIGSVRQMIVPNHLLGRVLSIAFVLGASGIPLGTLLGGFVTNATGNVQMVYAVVGVLVSLIVLAFTLTALGHAESYLPPSALLPSVSTPNEEPVLSITEISVSE